MYNDFSKHTDKINEINRPTDIIVDTTNQLKVYTLFVLFKTN